MRQKCVLCKRIHEAHGWKYSPYQTEAGQVYGYFCDKWYKPSPSKEWIPQRIKDQRNENAKTLLQPWREDVPSTEFIEAYGSKNFTKDEVKKAKKVWEKDVLPSNWKKTK